jgi:colanic acid/amylovoran biosynthesis protein
MAKEVNKTRTIIVDIYFDLNIGDDYMGDIIIDQLLSNNYQVMLIKKEDFLIPSKIKSNSKIVFIDAITKELIKKHNVILFVKVGGSIFPHGTWKEGIKRFFVLKKFERIKRYGVKIAILGISMGPFISKVGVCATKKILKISDLVTTRDKNSYQFIKKQNSTNSHLFSDLLFSTGIEKTDIEKNDVGISVYTGYAPYLRKNNNEYAKLLIQFIDEFSLIEPDTKIKLFLFDTGYNTDYPVANYILNTVHSKNVDIIPYSGDYEDFIKSIETCKVMVCTRFHSIVFSLLLDIPIIPIIYSTKSSNLLSDISFKNLTINIEESSKFDPASLSIYASSIEKKYINVTVDNERRSSNGHIVELLKLLEKTQ